MRHNAHGWDEEIEKEGLWRERERERNGAYGGQREDGWRAADKLSFRQRSRMCAGEEKRRTLSRCGEDGGRAGGCEGGGNRGGEKRGKGNGRREERREGPRVHNPLTDSFVE